MKRLTKNSLLILSMVSFLAIVSCTDDPEDGFSLPTISATTSVNGVPGITANPGDSISYAVEVFAGAGINRIYGELWIDGAKQSPNLFDWSRGTEVTTSETYASTTPEDVLEENAGQTWTMVFVAVDEEAQQSTDTVTVSIGEITIDEFEAVLIGGQANATLGSFYDAVDDSVYFTAGAAANNAKIDLVYYYINTEANPQTAIIASPDNDAAQVTFGTNWPFTTENSTMFQELDAAFDFDAVVSSAQVGAAYSEVATSDSRVVGLSVGDKVSFKLDASKSGKIGIFEVMEITGTNGADRAIKIDVKVQK